MHFVHNFGVFNLLPPQHQYMLAGILQCVKDAVDKHLSALTKEHPERRAVLITFGDEVLTLHFISLDGSVV